MALTNVLSLAAIFAFLYHRSREGHLLLWSLSWLGQSLRYISSLLVLVRPESLLLPVTVQWFSLAAGGFLVWGTAVFVAGRTPRYVKFIWIGILAAAMWPLFATGRGYSFLWSNLPTYVVLAAAFIWTGIAFLRWPESGGPARHLVGWGMILWGIHKVDFPLLAPIPYAAVWGYGIATALGIVVAAGVVVAYLDRALRRLHASENRFQLLAENASDLLFHYRLLPEPGFQYLSPTATAMLGYAPEELYTDPDLLSKIAHPDDRQLLSALLREPPAPGTTVVTRWQHRDGQLVFAEARLSPVFDARSRYIGLEGVARDVTERTKAEQALAASEQRYRNLYQSVHAGVVTYDAEGRVVDANTEAQRLLGVTLPEMLGCSTADIGKLRLISEDGQALSQDEWPCARALREGKAVSDLVVGVQNHDESVRWLLVNAEPNHVFEADSPPGAMVTYVDITERKHLEDGWRESDRRFRDLLQSADLLAVQINREGKLVFCNDHFLELTGWTAEEAIGIDWFDHFIPEEEREARRRRWVEHVTQGHGLRRKEYDILTRTGERRLVRWNRTWLLDARGQLEGAASIGEDVTQLRALQRQLAQSQKLESVGRLAGGVAHDFNNLLTAVVGYASLALSEAADQPELREDVMEILAAADRGSQLTHRLLAFARQAPGEPKPVDVNRLVLDLQKLLRRLISEDISIVISVEAEPAVIAADASQLEQVLVNLVVNARDAMPDGGNLAIQVANVSLDEKYAANHLDLQPGEYVSLTVSDTGVGMDATVKERLFEPFFTTKEPDRGTGLGLAVVYGIVHQYGGSVWVYSEPGQGTTFNIYFPRAVGVEEAVSGREPLTAAILGGDEKVLLVEDEASVRDITSRILESQGYTVIQAASGPEAISAVERSGGHFDLLLTDVVMPRMSGPDLAAVLRADRPDLAVLYISGFAEQAVARHGVLATGMEFLAKPYTSGELLSRVRSALDGRKQ